VAQGKAILAASGLNIVAAEGESLSAHVDSAAR